MIKKYNFTGQLILLLLITGCVFALARPAIPEGILGGVFFVRNGTEVPVNFEITGKRSTSRQISLLNRQERMEADALTQKGNSLFAPVDQFDNELALEISDEKLNGTLTKKVRTGSAILVEAVIGQQLRFEDNGYKPAGDISGTYDINFNSNSGKEARVSNCLGRRGTNAINGESDILLTI